MFCYLARDKTSVTQRTGSRLSIPAPTAVPRITESVRDSYRWRCRWILAASAARIAWKNEHCCCMLAPHALMQVPAHCPVLWRYGRTPCSLASTASAAPTAAGPTTPQPAHPVNCRLSLPRHVACSTRRFVTATSRRSTRRFVTATSRRMHHTALRHCDATSLHTALPPSFTPPPMLHTSFAGRHPRETRPLRRDSA
jgi:hypothetical protein